MAGDGEKVGDGYIEVGVDLDQSSLLRAEGEINASLQRNVSAQVSLAKQRSKALLDNDNAYQSAIIRNEQSSLTSIVALQQQRARAEKQVDDDLNKQLIAGAKQLETNRYQINSDGIKKQQQIDADFVRAQSAASKEIERIFSDGNNNTRGSFKKLTDDLPDEFGRSGQNSAGKFFSSLLSPLPGSLEKLVANPQTAAILAGIIAAVGPGITSAVGGAIIAGIGAAGIGTALAAQFNDARVQTAMSNLKANVLNDLGQLTAQFAQPFSNAFRLINISVDAFFRTIQPGFDSLQRAIGPLSLGLSQFIDILGPSLNEVLAASGPLLTQFAQDLPHLGQALADLLHVLASNADILSTAFHFLIVGVEGLIEILTIAIQVGAFFFNTTEHIVESLRKLADNEPVIHFLGFLADKLGISKGLADAFSSSAQGADKSTSDWNPHINDLNNSLNQTSSSALTAGQSLGYLTAQQAAANAVSDQATAKLNTQLTTMNAANEATEGFAAANQNLTNSLNTNGASLDVNSTAGRANRDALEAAAGATVTNFNAQLASHVPIAQATADHNTQIESLKQEAINHGADKATVDALVSSYGKVPTDVTTLLAMQGFDATNTSLGTLLVKQYALQNGITEPQARTDLQDKNGGVKIPTRATGGLIHGPGTGTSDSILGRDRHTGMPTAWVSNKEFVVNANATQAHLPLLQAINASVPGLASGGQVKATYPFKIDVTKTLIPDIYAAISGFLGASGDDSVASILAVAKRFDGGARVSSGTRPGATGPTGNKDYHNVGLAADLVGNMDAIAKGFYAISGSLLEEIHAPSWFVKNGAKVGPEYYGAATVNEHYDHVHIAARKDAMQAILGGASGSSGALGGAANSTLMAYIAEAQRYVGIEWPQGLLTLINRESGGNSNAINLTDSNAAAGDPSVGLMQIIRETFERYRDKRLPDDRRNPVANIVAGMNYIHARYGNLHNVAQANTSRAPQGFNLGGLVKLADVGTILDPGMNLVNNQTGGPERLWTDGHLANAASGGGGTMRVIFDSEAAKAFVRVELDNHDDELTNGLSAGRRI